MSWRVTSGERPPSWAVSASRTVMWGIMNYRTVAHGDHATASGH